MVNKELIISILVFCLVLIIIILCVVVVLNQFSPFKECESKSDDYVIGFGQGFISCGELRAINTSLAEIK